MRTAFVFTGGGSLGALQVGMLRALVQRDVRPDLVVGASVGALNAVFFGGNPSADGVERLADVWRDVTRRRIFPLRATRGLLGLVAASDGLVDASGLRRLIARHLAYTRLENAALPCIVVATDLATGRETGFSEGRVADLLLASAAIPGIFAPVEIGGRAYVDGGVASNTPISAAVRAGAQRILVLGTGLGCVSDAKPAGALAVAIHSLNHMIGRQLARDFERFRSSVELRLVPTLCPAPVSAYDFSRTGALIEMAARTTSHWLDAGGLDEPLEPPVLDTPISLAS